MLQDWQNFYMLTGAAAATLIGLLFVAVSAGGYLPAQQAQSYLRTFVTPTLIYYVQVLLISCLVVMPLHSVFVLDIALLILGGFNVYLPLKVLWRIRVIHHDDESVDNDHWLWHIVLPLLAGFLFVVTAIGLYFAEPFAFDTLSITHLLCLAIGLHNSWILMIWLTLRRELPHPTSRDVRQEENVL